jgi:TRAP-type C4-dicarboxylate transport system substrate-binding protein
MQKINLKWVIAHEPAYLFYRVAEDFAGIVNSKSKDHSIEIEILTAEEYNEKYSPAESITRHNLWKLLQDNTVQITQMQTTSLARQFNKQMHVFDLPYLFRDHDHAAEVLEGKIGTQLLNKFDESSRLKGLAYTYSGGFRLLPVNRSVTSLGEIMGMPVRSGLAPQAIDTIQALGGIPVPADLEETQRLVREGEVMAAEYVTQRIIPDGGQEWIKTIINTEHSLFLTSIVVNVDWWNQLPADLQSIFMEAAVEAARNERDLSIKDGETSLETLKKDGVTMIDLSDAERQALELKGLEIQNKYADSYFEVGLVDKIRTTVQ